MLNPANWSDKMTLTVRNDMIDSDLTDFPVMINLSSSSGMGNSDTTDIFDKISTSNRKKIAITEADGTTQQYVEIESWDSTLKKAILWTKCPTLYSNSTNTLYLYYDATASGNDSYIGETGSTVAANVWDSNFKGVWHFSESGGPYVNSTSISGIDGTGAPAPTRVTSHIGFCQDFDTDIIEVSDNNALDMTTEITMECLFNIDTWDTAGSFFISRSANGYSFYAKDDGSLAMGKNTIDELASSTGLISLDTDYYGVGIRKASDGNDYLYLDGAYLTSAAKASFSALSDSIYFGENKSAGTFSLIGTLDEVRLSDIARSSAYIKANHYNLKDDLVLFATVSGGAAPWLSDWSKRIEFTIDSTKVDENLFNYPLLITLASGTGITNQDVTDVFDELTVTSSGTGVDSYTKLLVHPEGDVSSSSHTITFNGGPKITSTAPSSGYGYSLYFDGTNDNYTAADSSDWDLAGSIDDYTIDFWVKHDDHVGTETYIAHREDGTHAWYFAHVHGSGLQLRVWDGIEIINTGFGGEITDTDWHHIALVKEGTSYTIYKDGVSGVNISDSSTATFTGYLIVGDVDTSITYPFMGYMTDLRVSKGVARWNSNFTPPTTSSGIDSYVKLLVHPEGDLSSNEHIVNLNGDMQINSSEGPFDASYYFDGTGDYVSLADHTDWSLGSENFTIDWWMKRGRNSTAEMVWGQCDAAGTGASISIRAYIEADNLLSYYLVNTTVDSYYYISDTADWHHYATVRNGEALLTFVDGVLVGNSYIGFGSLVDSTSQWSIGRQGDYNGLYFQGYISEFRISKGIARWIEEFTPPQSTYPNSDVVVSKGNKKIAITLSTDQAQMYTEIAEWNSYTKEAELWVQVPYISTSEDTTLYLYYDSSKPDNTEYIGEVGDTPAIKVWQDLCMAVWHMNQDPSVYVLKDSTGNNIYGDPNNLETEDLVDGLIGKAINIDGDTATENIDINDNATFLALTRPYTVQMIVKLNSIINSILFSANVTDSASDYSFGFYANDIVMGSSSWYYGLDTASNYVDTVNPFLWTVNFTSNTDVDLYLNEQKQTLVNVGNAYGGTESAVGGRVSTYQSNCWIDEFRIYYAHRSDGWVKTDYYNFNNNLITFSAPTSIPTFVFTGYVKVVGIPAARTVYLYRRSNGEFVGSVVSNESNGYFEIPGAYDEYHFVVILPEIGDGYNLLSYDQISPGS